MNKFYTVTMLHESELGRRTFYLSSGIFIDRADQVDLFSDKNKALQEANKNRPMVSGAVGVPYPGFTVYVNEHHVSLIHSVSERI